MFFENYKNIKLFIINFSKISINPEPRNHFYN